MAKKIVGYIKLQVPAAQANPSPPIGPALGQHGVNIMEFCKAFNARTQGQEGHDYSGGDHCFFRSVFYLYHQNPAGFDVVEKRPLRSPKVPKFPIGIRWARSVPSQIEEIAKLKMPDLNANTLEAAKKIIEGTALSMGIEIG